MITYHPHWGPLIAHKAGATFNPACDRVVARVRLLPGDEQELMGGSVFSNYTHESIGMHVAHWVPNWINRELLFHTFGYPFLQLGVARIFGQVPADNADALRFDLHLGFREIARIPKVFKGGVDDIVVCMEKDECRFLRRPKDCSQSNRLAA
jgi:RimJ/RimL family protein N-acetyltransferase